MVDVTTCRLAIPSSLLQHFHHSSRSWSCFQEHGIERATALLILCANPHVVCDTIRGYLTLVPEVSDVQDGTGIMWLHILCSLPHQDNSSGDAIRAYLKLGPEATNMQDSDGITPFQHLCRSEVTFLDDSNFSSLMICWYHCMPFLISCPTKGERSCRIEKYARAVNLLFARHPFA